MDSKLVSFLSTAAGLTFLHELQRYSSKDHSKVGLPFPYVVKQYNDYIGGVYQHDAHCSNLFPYFRSKNGRGQYL